MKILLIDPSLKRKRGHGSTIQVLCEKLEFSVAVASAKNIPKNLRLYQKILVLPMAEDIPVRDITQHIFSLKKSLTPLLKFKGDILAIGTGSLFLGTLAGAQIDPSWDIKTPASKDYIVLPNESLQKKGSLFFNMTSFEVTGRSDVGLTFPKNKFEACATAVNQGRVNQVLKSRTYPIYLVHGGKFPEQLLLNFFQMNREEVRD